MNLREIFDTYSLKGVEGKGYITFESFQQAIADYEKSKWKTGFPDLIEGKTYSRNVIAEVEGFTDLQIMCVFHITDDIDYMAWDKGFDGLYGDCVFDDNYNVIRWTEIPTLPTI